MTGSDDIARSNNPHPQCVVIFVHWLCAISLMQSRLASARVNFDREEQWRVQPCAVRTKKRRLGQPSGDIDGSEAVIPWVTTIRLTDTRTDGSLAAPSRILICREFAASLDPKPSAGA